jgi:hypothetical protein
MHLQSQEMNLKRMKRKRCLHEDIWGNDVYAQVFLTSVLAGSEWSNALTALLPGTHWIGRWVGPRADLDDVEI